jgi:hypothetical protein
MYTCNEQKNEKALKRSIGTIFHFPSSGKDRSRQTYLRQI